MAAATKSREAVFRVAPPLELKKLEAIFRHKIFRMLLKKGKITKELIAMLSTWRHSGFNVFCGNRILPNDKTAMENLARYIILISFGRLSLRSVCAIWNRKARSSMSPEMAGQARTSPAMEWLAAMCSHITNRSEQMVRYYGDYCLKVGKFAKNDLMLD
ncbi:MAG: transposase [Smithella sp.]